MKIVTKREQLLQPLNKVVGVTDEKSNLPILANVLMHAREGEPLALTATDLEVELSATTEITVHSAEEVGAALPARKLRQILRELPGGADLSLVIDGDKARLTCGRSRFSLATLPAADFPTSADLPFAGSLQLPQRALKRLIERTHFAMAVNDVRYYLNGLLLEVDGGTLRAVATDGHRLAYCETASAIEGDQAGCQPVQVIVPRKGVQELLRLLDDSNDASVILHIGATHLEAMMGEIRLSTKLIDGKFPDYQRVIPRASELIGYLMADRAEFKDAVTKVATLSDAKFNSIRLMADEGFMRLTTHNPEGEEAEDEIAVEFHGDGMDVGMNAAYLLDVLGVFDCQFIKMSYTKDYKCLLEDDGSADKCVIMPMRL